LTVSSKLAPFPSVFLTLYRPLEEAVDLLGDRVEVEARPVRGGDAEPSYQRLTAMVPGADRDAPPVEDLGDVVRMDALDSNETIPRAPLRWRPKDMPPGTSAGHSSARAARACSCSSIASMPISVR